MSVTTDYLDDVFNKSLFESGIDLAAARLLKFGLHKFDSIAFSGVSGAAYAFPLAYKLGVNLINIRKEDSAHYPDIFEGYTNSKKYIIVDDFVETGATLARIQEGVKAYYGVSKPRLVGIYLYTSNANEYSLSMFRRRRNSFFLHDIEVED
jgi:orotate phosphoribosyltransferase-like protein